MSDATATPEWTVAGRLWLASLPKGARDAALAYPPWIPYRYAATRQRAIIERYEAHEDGSCDSATCMVFRDDNPSARAMATKHRVTGIPLVALTRIDTG